jgi:hypothetical protein
MDIHFVFISDTALCYYIQITCYNLHILNQFYHGAMVGKDTFLFTDIIMRQHSLAKNKGWKNE